MSEPALECSSCRRSSARSRRWSFVVVFNFFLFRVVEGDPVANLFRGRNLTQEQREELRHQFGLDGSKLEQFGAYLKQTAQLNFGRSYISNEPVCDEICERAWPTIALVGISTLLSTVFGVLIGIVAAWKRGSPTDYGVDGLHHGDLLDARLLARDAAARRRSRVSLGLFPVGGMSDPDAARRGSRMLLDQAHHMFLPALTLTLAYLGEYSIVMRSSLLDTMREDYLTLARAKGLRDVVVRNRHAVPNAILPVVTLIAINFGFVLSGAIAVETIFSWPGLGRLTYDALNGPDLPMLQGLFLVFSAAVIFFNLIADLLYALPRPAGAARHEHRRLRPSAARRVAWQRRRRALGRGVVATTAHSVPGMIGLVVLLVIVAMALAAPLLASHSELRAINAIDNPTWASPVRVRAARHRQPRSQRLGAVRLGCADQPARRARGDRDRDRDRLARRHRRRLLRWLVRRRADAPHRVVPRDPVPAARDRARGDAGPVGLEHHLRDRDHVVAGRRRA